MSAKYNIVCDQATTFNLEFTIQTGNTLWNLTNYSATMTIRPFVGSNTTTLVLTNGNGITLGGAAGTVDITISAAVTADFEPSRYAYDFVLDSGTVVTRLLEGKFIVTAGVTL
jgi:carbon monoxide dehydrogenase subunit G